MTATRIVGVATLAVAVAAWVVAAWLLWRTTVPGGLRLPTLDEHVLFGTRLTRDAQRFERFLDWEWVVATVSGLAAYAVVARRARTLAPRLGLGPANRGIVLGVLAVTAAWAVDVPFALAANWWERRHGVSRETYLSVIGGAYGRLIGTTVVVFVVLALVLGTVRRFGRMWWLPSALAVAAVLLLLQLVAPYEASIGTHPVRSRALSASIRTLEAREHAGRPPVRVEDVGGRTRAANAFTLGIGPTERVILWSTMLSPRFTAGQVRFVVAHELGHVVRNHVARGVAWFALLSLPVLLVTSLLVDLQRPAAVPLAILVVTALSLALLPLRNAISRRYESEADWIALDATRDPAAAPGLFRGFVATSLEDPSPPGWVHVLLDDHPTPLQRVELARAWRARAAP
jgi:Zn-dependent protease with chaperone function